ncbi:predicted protein [Streptomyces sp. AA4]|nr:predicted protein [Streptomyces sp. AA4]
MPPSQSQSVDRGQVWRMLVTRPRYPFVRPVAPDPHRPGGGLPPKVADRAEAIHFRRCESLPNTLTPHPPGTVDSTP